MIDASLRISPRPVPGSRWLPPYWPDAEPSATRAGLRPAGPLEKTHCNPGGDDACCNAAMRTPRRTPVTLEDMARQAQLAAEGLLDCAIEAMRERGNANGG